MDQKISGRKWYVILQIENDIENKIDKGNEIAIDVGIEKFAVDSEGRAIEYPGFVDKIIYIQKELSRKVKGSGNYEKTRKKLANLYERMNDQRKDFLHKLSRFYVNNYGIINNS